MEIDRSASRGKSGEKQDPKEPITSRPVIGQACSACQKRKSKCDGKRPSCSMCLKKKTECYFTDDGRHMNTLRRQNKSLKEKLSEYEPFIRKLQQRPEEEAVELLRSLRRSKPIPAATSPSGSLTDDPLASPSDEIPPSPSTPGPGTLTPRGSSWHPALRLQVPSSYSAQEPGGLPIHSRGYWIEPGSPSSPTHPSSHVELFGNFSTTTGLGTAQFSEPIHLQQSHRIPIHFLQSSIVVENSPLSTVYTDYRDRVRQLIAGGAPLQNVMGSMEYINVDLYFEPPENYVFSANFWACETLKHFDEFEHAEKLGLVVLLTHLMRWTIHPTAETYDNVPDMIRPTPSQLLIPHVPSIDLVPIPAMRDALISNFRDWITITSQTMHLEWPHRVEESVEIDQHTGCRKLTARFEEFAKDPDHWTFDRDVLKVFPELEGKLSLRDDVLSGRSSRFSFLEQS